jgi:segregation and condensation protein A
MTTLFPAIPANDFEAPPPGAALTELRVDLDGFEGPLDVLLALAREQKVDLKNLSIAALADQYIAFMERAQGLRLELAADYLVMAAWLAWLKSRLLLPAPPQASHEPDAAEAAAALAFQLQRLQAMREASERLMARPRLGVDVFARGAPDGITVVSRPKYESNLIDLLRAYGRQKSRQEPQLLRIEPMELYSMELALERLSASLGRMPDWTLLTSFLPAGLADGLQGRSALAATLSATLEMVRTGRIHVRQDATFGPIYVRRAPENTVTELPVERSTS